MKRNRGVEPAASLNRATFEIKNRGVKSAASLNRATFEFLSKEASKIQEESELKCN